EPSRLRLLRRADDPPGGPRDGAVAQHGDRSRRLRRRRARGAGDAALPGHAEALLRLPYRQQRARSRQPPAHRGRGVRFHPPAAQSSEVGGQSRRVPAPPRAAASDAPVQGRAARRMTDVAALLDGARALVTASLPELLERRREIRWKEDGSPVTAADVLLETRISSWLAERLPGLALIGEESYAGGPAPGEGWVALLDPIDGTENFCSGLSLWGVSLSLWQGGAHRGSLLMLPELGDHLASGGRIEPFASRIAGFSSSWSPAIADGLAASAEGRIFGCAVFNLLSVVRG